MKSDRASYTALDFRSWRETSSLEVSPKFQRRPVWKRPAKSYLIDSLIKEMPIPPLYLRRAQSADRTRTIREVIDGQQRIRAVLDYLDNKYSLAASVCPEHPNKNFDALPGEIQDKIRNYTFNCEVFQNVSDQKVLEIFSRMNTNSVALNAQELRNGTYFGLFKQTAYQLALEHLEFWQRNRIFSATGIARMQEVELTSELMIAQLAGLQDKKKSIEKFYSDYDENFSKGNSVRKDFRTVVDAITESLGDSLGETEFRRRPLFYSLFCAVRNVSTTLRQRPREISEPLGWRPPC